MFIICRYFVSLSLIVLVKKNVILQRTILFEAKICVHSLFISEMPS